VKAKQEMQFFVLAIFIAYICFALSAKNALKPSR
jgi:hypothetical protein